jgi:hypothetical protein
MSSKKYILVIYFLYNKAAAVGLMKNITGNEEI